MNWALLILGIPVGVLSFHLGDLLCKKMKPKSATAQALVHVTPLTTVCALTILIDILF
jgi:hypothetical protein